MATRSVRFQLRNVKSNNEILLDKEPGIKNGVLKIGDGVNTWSNLKLINRETIIVDVADIVDNQRIDSFLELTAKYVNKEIDILFKFENIIFTPSAIGNEGWFFCAYVSGFYLNMAVLYEHGQLVVESHEGDTVPPNGIIDRHHYNSNNANGNNYDFIQSNEIVYAKYKKSVTKESIADLNNSDWQINDINCDAGYGKFKVDTVSDYDISMYWLYIGYAWDNATKQYIATPNSVVRTDGEDYTGEPLSLIEILTIQEGDDAQNPLLISWLQQHGDLLGVYEYKPLGQGGGSGIQDVKINGTSIVNNGVANIPIWDYGGVMYSVGNGFGLVPANSTEISKRSPARKPVTMENMDVAFRECLVNNKGTLTAEQKANACKWLGATKLYKYTLDNVGEDMNQTLVLISPNDNLSIRRVYSSNSDMFLCINTIGPYDTQIFPTIISAALYPFEGIINAYHTASNIIPMFTVGTFINEDTWESYDSFCGISGFHFYMNYPEEDIYLSTGNGAFVTMSLNNMLPYYIQNDDGWYNEGGTAIVDVKPLYRMEV